MNRLREIDDRMFVWYVVHYPWSLLAYCSPVIFVFLWWVIK